MQPHYYTKEEKQKLFYSHKPVFSYASDSARVILCNGGRGTGKSFDYKLFSLTHGFHPEETLEKRDKWRTIAFMRRYDIELPKVRNSYLDDLYKEDVIPGDPELWHFEKGTLYYDDKPKVFFIALNLNLQYKSVTFSDTDYMIFDEFVIDKKISRNSSYISDEVQAFLNMYETINRSRDWLISILIGNCVDFTNPYFAAWHVTPFEGRFHWFGEHKRVLMENYSNPYFEEMRKKSATAELLMDTDLGDNSFMDYIIYNKCYRDDPSFIRKKSSNAIFKYGIRYMNLSVGIFYDKFNKALHCDFYRKHLYDIWHAPRNDCQEGEIPLKSSERSIQLLVEYSNRGKLYFTHRQIKGMIYDLLSHHWK